MRSYVAFEKYVEGVKVKTVRVPICERCERAILNEADGLIVQGNLYSACIGDDGNPNLGIIGSPTWLDDLESDRPVKVPVTAMCKPCFVKVVFGEEDPYAELPLPQGLRSLRCKVSNCED